VGARDRSSAANRMSLAAGFRLGADAEFTASKGRRAGKCWIALNGIGIFMGWTGVVYRSGVGAQARRLGISGRATTLHGDMGACRYLSRKPSISDDVGGHNSLRDKIVPAE